MPQLLQSKWFIQKTNKGIGISFKIVLVDNTYHLTLSKSFLFTVIMIMKVASQASELLVSFQYFSVSSSRGSEGDHFCKSTPEIAAANIH